MKKHLLPLFLLALLLMPVAHLTAQNDITISITPKVRLFPSSGFSYIDDPARYFDIQLMNTSGSPKQIYLKLEIEANFTASSQQYYLRTRENAQPLTPLTVGTVPMHLDRTHFDQLLGHLSRNNIDYFVGNSNELQALNNVLTLPEGIYNICLTPYYWTGNNSAVPQKAGERVCYPFTVCYSGSAPEFTSPINGNSAANLNNSNPANNLLTNRNTISMKRNKLAATTSGTTSAPSSSPSLAGSLVKRGLVDNITSDSRNSSQYTMLPAERVVNFNWTGVISNCLSPNDFIYTLKIVEVYKNQSLHDAIEHNATLATIKNGSKTFYRYDTLTNRQFQFKKGHVYAMQVIATLNKNLPIDVKLGNDGKSQIIAFVWGSSQVIQDVIPITSTVSDNYNSIRNKIRRSFLVSPGQDKGSIETLIQQFPGETANIPADDSKVRYVPGENGSVPYCQIPANADSLSVKWMPVRGDSIIEVDYTLQLFEYKGGALEASFTTQPLKEEKIVKIWNGKGDSFTFGLNNTELQAISTADWGKNLVEGYKYVVRLKANAFFSYNERTTYKITEYIHNTPISRDSIINQVKMGGDTFISNVVFLWGVDSAALDNVRPPQFTYPVMLADKALDDTSWGEDEFPEVTKRKDFSFHWEKATGVYYEDTVYYRLRVGKLPDKKKPNEVTSFFYTKDSITATEFIDSTLFDTLKTDAQYVAVLDITIKQTKDTSQHYNLLNKGTSHYAAFRLKEEPEFKSDLNTKLVCDSSKFNSLDKEAIFPKPDELIREKKELMMGEFPMVMQRAQYDSTKKVYSGDGYVIWRPLGIDVRLKVDFKEIQFNKNYEIIKGTAVSSATDSATYLSALTDELGLELDSLGTPELNKIVSYLGNNEAVKKKYETFKSWGEKYAKKYGGLLGPLQGGNIATEVLTFPLSVTDETITGSKNVVFVINNMYFSPISSLMGFWAIFAASSDNTYVPFLANNICMDPGNLLGDASQHIEMYMGRDYEFDLNDGYKMRFKKSSSFSDPKDGTVLVIDSGKLKDLFVEIDFQMNDRDLMKIGKDGTPTKATFGKPETYVRASFRANLRDWDDWMVQIKMDAFAPTDCQKFSFYPTGKGIWYDHSSTKTPDEIAFPKGYLTGNIDTVKAKTLNKTQLQAEKDKAMSKARLEWQGFYWNEMTIFLSEDISTTFTDKEQPKDSMVVYHYGINNSQTDSALYHRTGTRINFGAKDIFIDSSGFTAEFFVRDILKAETKNGGGWAFSLDTVSVKILKNEFHHAIIAGAFGVPLFSGDFRYRCAIGADSLTFNIDAAGDTLNMDLWLAKIIFDKKSSCFRVKKIYKEEDTRFDMTLSGKINVNFKKLGIPLNFTLCKFEGMGMRNYNTIKDTNTVDGFEFTIGNWSWASPQHSIGGLASGSDGLLYDLNNPDGKGTSSISNDISNCFSTNIKKFDPIVSLDISKGALKLGFKLSGDLKFSFGENNAFGGGLDVTVCGTVYPLDGFRIEDPDAKLDEIRVDCELDVFHLKGSLTLHSDDDEYGDGLSGSLMVSCMGGISLWMQGNFGTMVDKNNEKFSYWSLNGGAKFLPGIQLGVVTINGFSGGFAYNMKATKSLNEMDAKTLLGSVSEDKGDTVQTVGMSFTPEKGSWVANAGICLILTGAESTMNMDGLVSLRICKGHFSGIIIQATAYVMTSMLKDVTPGDGENNKNTLLQAAAIIGYEDREETNEFRFSINVKMQMDLDSLLNLGGAGSKVKGKIKAAFEGASMLTGCNLMAVVDSTETGAGTGNGSTGVSFRVDARVPIDLQIIHYKKQNHTDWYFAIGKPAYDDRVQLKAKIDLIVAKAEAEFTFYLQTGNAFAYELPDLSPALKAFFYGESEDKKMDTDAGAIAKIRKITATNQNEIGKGGGFCMGSTFHAELHLDFFLYLDIIADIGFDIALLNVAGKRCPDKPGPIGKNNFYALGQVYAALQGDVGLHINLGFWKGKYSIFSCGVGALFQGGGPNPSFAYGLLRFKVSLLGGLLKFNTSVDFQVGDVCVPGAGDPLANVKLFQSVTPGLETEKAATNSKTPISPMALGTIVSNMPWNDEVCLSDGKDTRRFYFRLMQEECDFKISTAGVAYLYNPTGSLQMTYQRHPDEKNTYIFQCKEGGFPNNALNKLYLKGRAFEWRKQANPKIISSYGGTEKIYSDEAYSMATGKALKNLNPNEFAWFNPLYQDTNSNDKYEVRAWTQDTTVYFTTDKLSDNLNDNVVYAWPYNGDPYFPNEEYIANDNGKYVRLFLRKDRGDLFNNSFNQTMVTKVYLHTNTRAEKKKEFKDLPWSYNVINTTVSIGQLSVKIPDEIYGKECGNMLTIYTMPKNDYESEMRKAEERIKASKAVLEKSRIAISDSVYDAARDYHGHNVNTSTINTSTIDIIQAEDNMNRKLGKEIHQARVENLQPVVSGSYSSSFIVSSGSVGGSNIKPTTSDKIDNLTSTFDATGANTTQPYSTALVNINNINMQQTAASKLSGVTIGGGFSMGSTRTLAVNAEKPTANNRSITRQNSGNMQAFSTGGSGASTRRVMRSGASSTNSKNKAYRQNKSIYVSTTNKLTMPASANVAAGQKQGYVTPASTGNAIFRLSHNIVSSGKDRDIYAAQLRAVYEMDTTFGRDTMDYQRIMANEEFNIMSSKGRTVYCWTWATCKYKDYTEFLNDTEVKDNIEGLCNRVGTLELGETSKDDKFTFGGNSMGRTHKKFGWMFTSWDYKDATKYMTERAQPPRAYFIVNQNTELTQYHNLLFNHFLDLKQSFIKSANAPDFFNPYLLRYFGISISGDGSYDELKDKNKDAMEKGLTKNPSCDFSHITRRISGDVFVNCNGADDNPSRVTVPKILDYGGKLGKNQDSLSNYLYSEDDFKKNEYNKSFIPTYDGIIVDYATPAFLDDMIKFLGFFKKNCILVDIVSSHVTKDGLGFLGRALSKPNRQFSYSSTNPDFDFPFDMPLVYLCHHYYYANYSFRQISKDDSLKYETNDGKELSQQQLKGNNKFLWVKDLKESDAYLAKFWWNTDAQPTNCSDYKDYKFICSSNFIYAVDSSSHTSSELLGPLYEKRQLKSPHYDYWEAFISIVYLTSKNSNFEVNLLNTAEAISLSREMVYFPNAEIKCRLSYSPSLGLNKNSRYKTFMKKPYLFFSDMFKMDYMEVRSQYYDIYYQRH